MTVYLSLQICFFVILFFFLLYNFISGPVHKFMHGWGPAGCPDGGHWARPVGGRGCGKLADPTPRKGWVVGARSSGGLGGSTRRSVGWPCSQSGWGGGPIGGRPGLGEEPQEVWGPIGALIGPAGLRNACHRDRSFWLFRLFQLFHWSGRLHFIYIDKLYCLLYLLNPFNILMLGCRRLTLTLSNSDAFHSLGIHQYILWNFWFV